MFILLEVSLVFLLTLLFVKYVRDHAATLGIIDIPNARSAHKVEIARGGGIGFFSAIMLITPIFHSDLAETYLWSYIGILLVFIVGIIDDRHTAPPKAKFIIISIATLLISFDGFIINDIGICFGEHISLGWFALPFTLFAVVGFTNALNLIDGIDGLSSTLSIIMLAALFSIGYANDDTFMMTLSLSFIVALFAFLLFNWHPASIFMGDSGSLTLGFVISLLSIKALDYVPAVSLVFLVAIPVFDTLYVIIRRKLNKRSAFSPDKCHIHHIVNALMEGNVQKTVFILGLIQFIYTLFALLLNKDIDEGILIILFIANQILVYFIFTQIIRRLRREC